MPSREKSERALIAKPTTGCVKPAAIVLPTSLGAAEQGVWRTGQPVGSGARRLTVALGIFHLGTDATVQQLIEQHPGRR